MTKDDRLIKVNGQKFYFINESEREIAIYDKNTKVKEKVDNVDFKIF